MLFAPHPTVLVENTPKTRGYFAVARGTHNYAWFREMAFTTTNQVQR